MFTILEAQKDIVKNIPPAIQIPLPRAKQRY